jgi:hypothetical protein
MVMKTLGLGGSRPRLGFTISMGTLLKTMRNKPFDYAAKVERAPPLADTESKMSTTSHKSNTRVQSEAAMKTRVHTSRKDRDLTGDGLDKHHHEAKALKAVAQSTKTKTVTAARRAKVS